MAHERRAKKSLSAEGRTYVVPITYAYDNNSVIGHSSEGLKMRMMRENPWVCVEVDHMDDLANCRSVIAWGRFEEWGGWRRPQRGRFSGSASVILL